MLFSQPKFATYYSSPKDMSQKFSSLYFFGRPFSPLYSGIMKTREALYLRGVKRRYKLDVPVISVGNLTMGGTGKTPVVGMLAALLKKKGFRPAIISRGYGGAGGNKVNVVSDGKELLLDAKAAGDEPCLLAKNLPGVPVLTGIVRILPCRHAISEYNCNVLILDDGFQHLSIQRDLDLVLFSAASLAGNSRVFPGGDLREPVSALKRCHAFVLTGVTDKLKERCITFGELLQQRFPDKPVFYFSYQPVEAKSSQNNNLHDLSSLPSPLYGFCGIAQPELFQNTLTTQNISLSGFMPLKDHQAFTPSLIKKIAKQADENNAQGLITTEKDLVKLPEGTFELPCFGLKMEVHTDLAFKKYLNEKLSIFTQLCHSSHSSTE
ncbi:MAG: tetraacyldisaccharide 4'-kinase [Thermodesulfobacteriota bacterium]|nr:tetraacyldisaccharide 4'-kinase [Thermodesulfobacteriota bacterium]